MSESRTSPTPSATGDQLCAGAKQAAKIAPSASVVDETRFGYRIGRFQFVLEKTETMEILVQPAIYKIPNGPYWLHGVINQRSNILPVVDLSKYIGVSMTSAKGEYVLVAGKGNTALALLVDEIPKTLTQAEPQSRIGAVNANVFEFVNPGLRTEQGDWLEFDVKALTRHLKQHDNNREYKPAISTKGK
ncbi:MAG: chemotaxis protein CheW [Gammaproteobacteria bacterium]|nr:chemotaxis protein CheW [Gammaproteobacteria bacterium]